MILHEYNHVSGAKVTQVFFILQYEKHTVNSAMILQEYSCMRSNNNSGVFFVLRD